MANELEEKPSGQPLMGADKIKDGAVYVYVCGIPKGVAGERYQVLHTHVLDVPSYQHKVLVKALTGRDRGLVFVCTPNNFIHRYKPWDGTTPAPSEQPRGPSHAADPQTPTSGT